MINYSDPNDPNYDPYWEGEKRESGEQFDPPPMDDLEFEELEEQLIREMREEGLLRPTLVKPGESDSGPDDKRSRPPGELDEDLPF
jgi:hypothetical protein